jgi:hypothetical protein
MGECVLLTESEVAIGASQVGRSRECVLLTESEVAIGASRVGRSRECVLLTESEVASRHRVRLHRPRTRTVAVVDGKSSPSSIQQFTEPPPHFVPGGTSVSPRNLTPLFAPSPNADESSAATDGHRRPVLVSVCFRKDPEVGAPRALGPPSRNVKRPGRRVRSRGENLLCSVCRSSRM